MNNEKNLIFGLGTGRCGTHSLCSFISDQENCFVTHEFTDKPFLSWDYSDEEFKKIISKIEEREEVFVGDIAFFLLNYAEKIIDYNKNSKFLVLKRDKKETVESYLRKTIGRNHWQKHDGKYYRFCEWDRCYPKLLAHNKKEAIGKYWDLYYAKTSKLQEKYPKNFLTMSTEDLNDNEKLFKILEFFGFENKVISFHHDYAR